MKVDQKINGVLLDGVGCLVMCKNMLDVTECFKTLIMLLLSPYKTPAVTKVVQKLDTTSYEGNDSLDTNLMKDYCDELSSTNKAKYIPAKPKFKKKNIQNQISNVSKSIDQNSNNPLIEERWGKRPKPESKTHFESRHFKKLRLQTASDNSNYNRHVKANSNALFPNPEYYRSRENEEQDVIGIFESAIGLPNITLYNEDYNSLFGKSWLFGSVIDACAISFMKKCNDVSIAFLRRTNNENVEILPTRPYRDKRGNARREGRLYVKPDDTPWYSLIDGQRTWIWIPAEGIVLSNIRIYGLNNFVKYKRRRKID
ncbi:hypothetical protein FQR65_LT16197 [Abscondita terminalis]|nr:hypothetical protein FQR65_LT16197 [Abscondita terminalis]